MGSRISTLSAALTLALSFAAAAPAREAIREPFEHGPAGGRGGKGWTQLDPDRPAVQPLSAETSPRGMISFDLQRRPDGDPAARGAVFALWSADGHLVFELSVTWESEADGRPGIFLVAPPRPGYGGPRPAYSTSLVSLGRDVAPGQWIHVDLVWDDEAGTCKLYVDGNLVTAEPRRFQRERSVPLTGPGEARTRGDGRREGRSDLIPWPFGQVLSEAAIVRWGDPGQKDLPRARRRADVPLAHAVVDNFVVVLDDPVELVTRLHRKGYDVQDLLASYTPEGVRLSWQPPRVRGVNQGYLVYRREGSDGAGRFERLTAERLYDLTHLDSTVRSGQSYRYSVTALYSDGRGRDLESQSPPEVAVTAAALSVASVAAAKSLYGAGEEIVVTLRGTQDAAATFHLPGVTPGPVAMEEVDDGVYVGRTRAPEGGSPSTAGLTGTLSLGGRTASRDGPAVGLDPVPPAPPGRIRADPVWARELELAWDPSPSADVDGYRIYRGEGRAPDLSAAPFETVRELSFVDTRVIPGLTYHYAVVAVDK
ncbi:MAG: hypothetical protein AB1578_21135, partial [Thermodesulfobacteriota bacterium]